MTSKPRLHHTWAIPGHLSHRVATFLGSVATLAAVGGSKNSTLYIAEREKEKEEKREEQTNKNGEKERKKSSRGKEIKSANPSTN
uniref:Uncharacterized protein n=1 Tax=Romanomermis culicivorax TaxID=13658 RepID=A0A915L4C9_ROMCU